MGAASQELTEKAKLLIAERRYQEAVRACRRALLSQPDEFDVRLLLGEALLALERYDEVRVEMMALARKNPKRAEIHRVLGEAYLRDGRPNQATEALRRALELDPNDEIARELLGEADDENAPVSSTIERWFSDEAPPTIEMRSPGWVEETTPVPGRLPEADATGPQRAAPGSSPAARALSALTTSPSKPSNASPLTPQATNPGRPGNVGGGPRVRSRKPTLAGYPSASPIAPPSLGRERATSVERPAGRPPTQGTEELDLESISDSAAHLGFPVPLGRGAD